mmetsp:Transcript_64989/g.97977  ORF Transcript_64989/g.97977 Transcript_64989/m.97977 type:complete len:617 (+) Transcript_64989:200-2050(+)|eukprot:CAMPEP_0117018202 /NCGR_PEP_ID=MMETSP0472-20121206/14102_1 /TAXON_ID=693140 ORGANISM="Tiarina fusus, Strain LIS" /NCGR_SAMPLE_ID=MMETSP0472 /ASSEMBLY_ACC=CAM_ASM_000603 /LENGTH=616 /DNA_ID=CAMNT_0004722775 /DNA_START=156 /DNA_END=2006 /DNA_ORIENTATION=+
MAAERNTEIWSTRLQRELLALTTDNASNDAKEEVAGVLPPYVTVKSHDLDIMKGTCTVSFLLDLPDAKKKKKEIGSDIDATAKTEAESVAKASVVVALDSSLPKKPDGSLDPVAVTYPFLKPLAILVSGSENFPDGSTVKDGDVIDIEMDWTPSLHLTDAILNISLKAKESMLQGEPFHPSTEQGKQDPVEEVMSKAKRIGASFSKGLRGLTEKSEKPEGEKKKGLRLGRKKKKEKKAAAAAATSPNPGEIRIGDEINMLEAPWVDCQGVYSCKAIRRPAFVDEAMAAAAKTTEASEGAGASSSGAQVANASFAGAGAMFRTFTQSARSVLEESFLMITDTHIIEMRSNKLNLSTGTVTFAIPIDMLAKLKFRRQESISLFFKPAPDDPLIYMCPDSADCVHQIQAVLKRHGVKGKHTNAATHRAINQALHLVQEIQTKELALKHDPTVDRVNEIMDLYRQAAERFEVAGDVRHEEVVTHMRKFLALPLTTSILDGSYKKPEVDDAIAVKSDTPDAVPEGLVLESSRSDAEEGETPMKPTKPRANSEDKAFEMNMENILKEAEEDLANMKMEDDPELDAMLDDDGALGLDTEDDAIADFENMLKEADDELAALMSS